MNHCFRCRQPVETGYICDSCSRQNREYEMELERQARLVDCPNCHQPKGQPCLGGSGTTRSWSHAKRQKLAKRYVHNTRGNKR